MQQTLVYGRSHVSVLIMHADGMLMVCRFLCTNPPFCPTAGLLILAANTSQRFVAELVPAHTDRLFAFCAVATVCEDMFRPDLNIKHIHIQAILPIKD